MKEPNHKVKRHIVPLSNKQKPYWIENPIHGWLGSGVKDENEREIFEGDIVNVLVSDFDEEEDYVDVVTFKDGAFWLKDTQELLKDFERTVEVVGHIAMENQHDN